MRLWRQVTSIRRVALRKESVDRNSPVPVVGGNGSIVALRKESVDRNWSAYPRKTGKAVALRKESVDRNNAGALPYDEEKGRSPQGERG